MPSYVKKHIRKTQAERREEIVEAALRLIGEIGLEDTTVSRIADAVGLTPGALYRHFESRFAVIDEANRVASRRALTWVEASGEPDMLRRFEELEKTHTEWSKQNLHTVLRSFFLNIASPPRPDMAPQITIDRLEIFQAFVDLAEEGKRQGSIRPDIPSEDVAWGMLMAIFAKDIALLMGADEYVADGTFSRNLKRLLDSYRAPKPERSLARR